MPLAPGSELVMRLAVDEERLSQRDIAEYLRLDPSQVVALVDDLQERHLVTREPDPADRRAKVVVATEAGRRLHGGAAEATRLRWTPCSAGSTRRNAPSCGRS